MQELSTTPLKIHLNDWFFGLTEGAGSLSVFESWAFEDHESVGYRFWVDPLEGAWKDTWIYHPGVAKRDVSWVDCYSPDRIGEPGNWGYYGGRRPFAATNFAKTTAAYFFKPNGPLER